MTRDRPVSSKRTAGAGLAVAGMLLAGVAVNFFFSSLMLLIQYTANFYHAFRILRWLMGGWQMVSVDAPLWVLPLALMSVYLLSVVTGVLNVLTTGEGLAVSRGVNVNRLKKIVFFHLFDGRWDCLCLRSDWFCRAHVSPRMVGADRRKWHRPQCSLAARSVEFERHGSQVKKNDMIQGHSNKGRAIAKIGSHSF